MRSSIAFGDQFAGFAGVHVENPRLVRFMGFYHNNLDGVISDGVNAVVNANSGVLVSFRKAGVQLRWPRIWTTIFGALKNRNTAYSRRPHPVRERRQIGYREDGYPRAV
jgi:hypothetical protein